MYEHIAPSYDELHGAEQRRKLDALLQAADVPDGPVLDVGCGTAHLADRFSEYVGVDPCRELLEQAPESVRVVCASGEDLPFSDASFPVVLSLTALHNYDDPLAGVQELVRVSREWVLAGVLKKSGEHDAIVEALTGELEVVARPADSHDTLLAMHKP